MNKKLFLPQKQIVDYFIESYQVTARLMGVDDKIEKNDWFIYTNIEALIVLNAFNDDYFKKDLKEKGGQYVSNAIVMEYFHNQFGLKNIYKDYSDKAKYYFEDLKKNGYFFRPPTIFYEDNVVVFPTLTQVHKSSVAHEAGHALYQTYGSLDDKLEVNRFNHEIFAMFTEDMMMRLESSSLEENVDKNRLKNNKLGLILLKSYDAIKDCFDNFEDFIKHMQNFFHGKRKFEDWKYEENHKPFN